MQPLIRRRRWTSLGWRRRWRAKWGKSGAPIDELHPTLATRPIDGITLKEHVLTF